MNIWFQRVVWVWAGVVVCAAAGGIGTRAGAQTVTLFPNSFNPGVYDLAPGPDGAVWFTRNSGNKIGRITPAGTVTEFPFPTSTNHAREITKGPDGAMWFVQQDRGKIGRITPSGEVDEFPLPSTSSYSLPESITSDNDSLYFTEQVGNRIGIINSTIRRIDEFQIPTPGTLPTSITAGPDGAVWFTEPRANKIGRMTATGTFTEYEIPTADSGTSNITRGPDGNLWFTQTNTGKIGRISPRGDFTEYPLRRRNSKPSGIVAGPDGALWFTQSYYATIGRITPAGEITEFRIPFNGPQPIPERIIAGPDGALWFSERTVPGRIGKIVLESPNRAQR